MDPVGPPSLLAAGSGRRIFAPNGKHRTPQQCCSLKP